MKDEVVGQIYISPCFNFLAALQVSLDSKPLSIFFLKVSDNVKEAAKLKRRANRKQNGEDSESSINYDTKNTADTKRNKNLSIRFLEIRHVQDVQVE